MSLEKIEQEIFRLINSEDKYNLSYNRTKNLIFDNLKTKIDKYKYKSYDDDVTLSFGEMYLVYVLEKDNLKLKIQKCDTYPGVKTHISLKVKKELENEIIALKNDFRSKGEIYTSIKKYLKTKNRLQGFKSTLKKKLLVEVDNYQNIINNSIQIEVGKTYTEDIYVTHGHYHNIKPVNFLKIIKENPKTYQIQYEFEIEKYVDGEYIEETKCVNVRRKKEDVINMFRIKKFHISDFRGKLKNRRK